MLSRCAWRRRLLTQRQRRQHRQMHARGATLSPPPISLLPSPQTHLAKDARTQKTVNIKSTHVSHPAARLHRRPHRTEPTWGDPGTGLEDTPHPTRVVPAPRPDTAPQLPGRLPGGPGCGPRASREPGPSASRPRYPSLSRLDPHPLTFQDGAPEGFGGRHEGRRGARRC